VHGKVAHGRTVEDAIALGDNLHDHVMKPWSKYNFDTEENAPYPLWDTTPVEDLKSKAALWQMGSQAIASLKSVGAPVDMQRACEMLGVPTVDVSVESTSDPDSALDRAASMKSVADSIGALGTASPRVDVDLLLQQFGVPLKPQEVATPSGADFYQYDIDFGVVTINEARARKGLPPLAGMDITLPQLREKQGQNDGV
jgi:hypothetical protein